VYQPRLIAEPRAKLSRAGLRWSLEGIVRQHLSVARVAEGLLAVPRGTANDAILTEARRILINDPHRFDGASAIGVDEHARRHTRKGDKSTTMITLLRQSAALNRGAHHG